MPGDEAANTRSIAYRRDEIDGNVTRITIMWRRTTAARWQERSSYVREGSGGDGDEVGAEEFYRAYRASGNGRP